jgi:hypothetical protein
MHRFNIPAIFKFAIGVLLVQGATVLLVLAAQRADLRETWLLMLGLGLFIGILAAFWFSSIASHCSQNAVARISEKFSKDRERIRRQTEKEKTREIKESHRQLLRETNRLHNRSNRKLVAGVAGLAALGVTLVFTQFMTLGLLALSLGGGALLGYAVRARQQWLTRKSPGPGPQDKMVDGQDPAVFLPRIDDGQRKTPR